MQHWTAEGRGVLEERRGVVEEMWNPKVCVPKTTQINVSFSKSHFSLL